MNQLELEANACSKSQARENTGGEERIGFGFIPNWLRKWCNIFKSITERSKAKPKPPWINLDTHCSSIC